MRLIKGAEKAKSIIERGLSEGRDILLIGDPDTDGLMSLKLMCDLFDSFDKQYSYYCNDHRKHGFTLNPSTLEGFLVVMADFAISRQEVLTLIQNNVYVVSLDHHDIDDSFIEYDNAVVINNQYSFEAEDDRYLSGAGVVYEVFKEIYPDFESKEREAIVGITLLSDVRAIENKKARKYLRTTYSSDDEYIRYLIEYTLTTDYSFGQPRMDRNYVDFTLSPTINAMLRFNRTSEAIDFVLGKGRGGNVDWRERQKQLIYSMMQQVEVLDLSNCYILAIDATKFDEDITGFIGLLCSRYKNKNKSALIFAYDKGKVIRASMRGLYDSVDYRKALQSIGIHAEGHHNAFGIVDFYPTADTWNQLNELIGSLEEHQTETRTIIETGNLSSTMMNRGMKIATDNCYVRDMYRTYIKYTGNKVRETKHTYKTVEFTDEDYLQGRKPEKVSGGISYKYELDSNGEKVTKYIEYLIDGRVIKSFGTTVQEGLIMPILEKGYIQLYVV